MLLIVIEPTANKVARTFTNFVFIPSTVVLFWVFPLFSNFEANKTPREGKNTPNQVYKGPT